MLQPQYTQKLIRPHRRLGLGDAEDRAPSVRDRVPIPKINASNKARFSGQHPNQRAQFGIANVAAPHTVPPPEDGSSRPVSPF